MPIDIDPSKVIWDTPEEQKPPQAAVASDAIDPATVIWDTEDPKPEAKTPETAFDSVARSIGISGRSLAQGVANLLGIVGDPLNQTVNWVYEGITGEPGKLESIRGATKKLLKDAGVPDYEGKTEELIGQVSELAVETAAGAGVGARLAKGTGAVTRKIGESLAEKPVQQVIAAETGLMGGKAAESAAEKYAPDSQLAQAASQLVGTAAGVATGSKLTNLANKQPYQAPGMVERGIQHDTRVLTSDVFPPQSPIGRVGQYVSERAPLGSHAQRMKQLQEKTAAVERLVDDFGGTLTDDLKPAIVEDLVKKRQGLFKRYGQMKKQVYDGLSNKGTVPVPNLTKALDDEIATAKHHKMDAYANFLEDIKQQAQSAFHPTAGGGTKATDIRYLDKVRELFGDTLKGDEFAAAREHIEGSKNKIYGAFKEDMGNFIQNQGKPGDFKKWQAYNKRVSNLIKEEKMASFKRVLKQADVQPEVVKTMIRTEDESVARQLYKSASPNGKKMIRAAVMQDIINKSGGIENLTPEKFVREVTKRQKAIGVFYNKEHRQAIESLTQLIKDTPRAELAATYSPISIVVPFAGFSTVASLFGGGAAGLAAAGGGSAGLGLLSRLVESKPSRDLLLRIQHYRNMQKRTKTQDEKLGALVKQFFNTAYAYQNEDKANE